MQLGCACAWSPLGTSHIPVKSLGYELPQGYVRDSTLAEDLFLYCFTVKLYGHLGFLQQIKKVKINYVYHLIRDAHTNILSSTYRPLCPSIKFFLWCHKTGSIACVPLFILLASPKATTLVGDRERKGTSLPLHPP